jgi:hypothetical protein
MSVASIANAIQDSGLFTAMRESALVYPIILSTHLACIAVFGGMILMTDLRLLGLAMTKYSVTDVVNQLKVWKRIGFVIMIGCGIMLGGAKFGQYYDNPYFQLKMFLLLMVGVHALIFRPRVYNNTVAIDRAPAIPGVAKLAACLSLALWLGIMSMGRWIAYYERPEEKGPVQKTSLMTGSDGLANHAAAANLKTHHNAGRKS